MTRRKFGAMVAGLAALAALYFERSVAMANPMSWREVKNHPDAFASLIDAVDEIVEAMDQVEDGERKLAERRPIPVPIVIDYRTLVQLRTARRILEPRRP